VVGALSTLFYLLLYSLFRQFSGSQIANALALLVSAVANTAANRRLTFGVRGRGGAVRHQAQGLVVFGIGLALTSGSLAALNAATDAPAHSTELAVLVAANLAATVLRFLLFRAWVFPERREAGQADGAGASFQPFAAGPVASSPTYSTALTPTSVTPGVPRQPGAYAPLPQRPTAGSRAGYGETPYGGTAAEGTYDGTSHGDTYDSPYGDTYDDGTARLRPVRPHDTDPRNSR
jgi:putative flippase GtrA